MTGARARTLITGGAGFIGSHVAARMASLGHAVHVLDSLHTYVYPIAPTYLENMNYRTNVLLRDCQVERGSTANPDSLRRTIMEVEPDYVVHLAALPLANAALRYSNEAFGAIVHGTAHLLEILRDYPRLRRLVYVSSSMIYGDFAQVPIAEEATPRPKEIYGGMKLCGEILARTFSQQYGTPVAIVRPSAVYGPTDNNRRVLQIFVENALQGRPIQVSDATTELDFTYVEDLARGIVAATLEADADGETFNLTCGQGRSLKEVAQVLQCHFPDLVVEWGDGEEEFRPRRGALSIAHARERIGYAPEYPLERGIATYLEHMRRHNPSIARRAEGEVEGGVGDAVAKPAAAGRKDAHA